MAQPLSAFQAHASLQSKKNVYTLTGLKRWSCSDNELPPVSQIKNIHVYDFDNTLFATPLPNKQLWNSSVLGLLQSYDSLAEGGWWHDSNILAATGQGIEKEEPKAWDGWWNEQIVNLVQLSAEQKDVVTVLLTGRSEPRFTELVQRILKSKDLEFDMTCLKPEVGPSNQKFASTMIFKQQFLEALMNTYHEADELRIYEDRPKHVTGFREFFERFNTSLRESRQPDRKPISAEVIEVSEKATTLDPVVETSEVQRMINKHNIAFRDGSTRPNLKPYTIKRTIHYTGYLITPSDSERLLKLANLSPAETADHDMRTMANTIMITPRPCPPHILTRVGGLGRKIRWRVNALGTLDNKLWAARVEPVSPDDTIYTETLPPSVVLALRYNAKPHEVKRVQNWRKFAPNPPFEFDTTVGEKVTLRIEQETHPSSVEGPPHKKLRSSTNDDLPPLPSQARNGPPTGPSQGNYRNGDSGGGGRGGFSQRARGSGTRPADRGPPRGANTNAQPRGGHGSFRASSRGGRRERHGGGGYRSLDDNNNNNNFGGDGARDDGGLIY